MKLQSRLARSRLRRAAAESRAEAHEPERPRKVRGCEPIADERAAYHPDLLHAAPLCSVDAAAIDHILSFAFAAGSADGALRSSLALTAVAPSHFHPVAFERGIFVEELITLCFSFSVDGQPAALDRQRLHRLFVHPPSKRADLLFRQAILTELVEQPALVTSLTRVYRHLAKLSELLDDEGADAHLNLTQWRIDVLAELRDAFVALDESFASAGSGLARLHAFAARVRTSESYARLAALLEFEGDAARAELRIRLGADGRIRALHVVQLHERRDSRFHVHPLRRLFGRLLAWIQGYRIGPAEVVERWLEAVFDGVREHLPTLLQLKGDLEFYLSAMHFKALAERRGLAVSLPSFVSDEDTAREKRVVQELWNPLLLGAERAPVPTDLTLPNFESTCITTGPNSGGKTRFLQALALCQLLGQCGGFVPASSAVLRFARGMFVSLGEQAEADQKEGRLGMELLRIRQLFEQASAGSVVILDELCSGTNPSEGEEIFRMLLELLHEVRHEVHVTTHFLSFTETLTSEERTLGLCFLQVELDEEQHPTHRFVPGIATTSLAQKTAERLGVTREQLQALVARHGQQR